MWSLIMGFLQPMTNLREYISQNPPGVTFFLCLLTLAISFICLSSYSCTHTLPNPDITKDWNHLLSSLSQFHLCVDANASFSELVPPAPTTLRDKDTSNELRKTSVTSLRLKVPLDVNTNSKSGSLKDLGLQITFRAKQLHLGGDEAINVTLEFLSGNDTHTCLTISAPEHFLSMSLLPPGCPASEKNISYIHLVASNQLLTAAQTCYSLKSKDDPTLTVMLTEEERSVAKRHLLEVGMGLLGICLVLCLAASLTHSLTPHSWNGQALQN